MNYSSVSRRAIPFLLLCWLLAACDSKVKVTDSCGDGVLDPGEQCDKNDFGLSSCSTEGYYTGNLACNRSPGSGGEVEVASGLLG